MNGPTDALQTLLLKGIHTELRGLIDIGPAIVHIEEKMDKLPAVLPLTHLPSTPILTSSAQTQVLYEALTTVFSFLTDSSTTSDVTVNDVVQSLLQHRQQTLTALANAEKEALQQLVVALIGCLSFLFTWCQPSVKDHCEVTGGALLNHRYKLHLENCTRSVASFLRSLALSIPTFSPNPRPEDLLSLSVLNFRSLVRVGRLRVNWVPHMNQHLLLDIHTRNLQLFRFPSICVLALAEGHYQAMNSKVNPPARNLLSIHREILLSVRFILGRTRKSRQLAHKLAFTTLGGNRDRAFDLLLEGKIDHLLNRQLGCSNSADFVTRQDFLTPWADFPILGERMLQLQKYNGQQQPIKTRTMFQDKRDPARWYTIWVVLLIGGVSIVLSAIQLILSAAQLAYAIKAVTGCG